MYKVLSLVLAGAVLTACSSDKVKIDDINFPVESVIASTYTTESAVNVYKNIENVGEIELNTVITPQTDTTFEGEPAKQSNSVAILKQGETEMSRNETEMFYEAQPFKFLGSKSIEEYEVASEHNPLPKIDKVGNEGVIHKTTIWSSEGKGEPIGNSVVTWSLSVASANTAWLCEVIEANYIDEATNNVKGGSCVEINEKGEQLAHKVVIYNNVEGADKEIVFMSK